MRYLKNRYCFSSPIVTYSTRDHVDVHIQVLLTLALATVDLLILNLILDTRSPLAGRFLLGLRFFLVLSVTNPKPLRMMSLSANYRLFHSSFRHIPPHEDFVKLANNCLDKKWLPTGKMFIWSNLGQNPSQMSVRTFARLKNLIWDQLLAPKAKIIQS